MKYDPILYYLPAFARCKLSMRCSFCSAFVENWCIWSQQLLIWLFSRQPSSGLGSGMGLNRAGSSSGNSSSPAALQVATPWLHDPGKGTASAAISKAVSGSKSGYPPSLRVFLPPLLDPLRLLSLLPRHIPMIEGDLRGSWHQRLPWPASYEGLVIEPVLELSLGSDRRTFCCSATTSSRNSFMKSSVFSSMGPVPSASS